MNTTRPTRTVAYLRVSTDRQADRGVSLEAQRAKVEAYATLYDLELVAVVEDAGASAKSLNRPGLNRVLSMLRKGEAEAVLVLKLDRLTRSVRDLGDLVDTYFADGKRALLSVQDQIDTRSAAGRLVLNVLASVSQWEREAIGERTSAAMQHKRSKGELVGAVPFGFGVGPDGKTLVANEAEQLVVAAVREYRAGGLSLRTIGKRLAERGMLPRQGGTWHAAQIQRIAEAA